MSALEIIARYEIYIIIALGGVCIFLFLLCIISFSKTAKLKKRIDGFMKTENQNDIEAMLTEYMEKSERSSGEFDGIKNDISELKKQISICIQKTGIVRFNPFDDVGGDLSFAVAFLDKDDNGVVISSIYSRESSYSYAKAVHNGESTAHKFSDEEKEAINIAKGK